MVEDMLTARGIIVSRQTIHLWVEKFGRHFAKDIRKRSAGRIGGRWHLDEVVVTIRNKKHWLWRAVDLDGFFLDVLVQSRRSAKAAKRLTRKLLKGQGQPLRVMSTNKLRSCDAAPRLIMPGIEHRSYKRSEQPGRDFPSANPAKGRDYEAFQVSRSAPTLRLHVGSNRQPLPYSPPSDGIPASSRAAGNGDARMERCRSPPSRLNTTCLPNSQPKQVKFTVPAEHFLPRRSSYRSRPAEFRLIRERMRLPETAGCAIMNLDGKTDLDGSNQHSMGSLFPTTGFPQCQRLLQRHPQSPASSATTLQTFRSLTSSSIRATGPMASKSGRVLGSAGSACLVIFTPKRSCHRDASSPHSSARLSDLAHHAANPA